MSLGTPEFDFDCTFLKSKMGNMLLEWVGKKKSIINFQPSVNRRFWERLLHLIWSSFTGFSTVKLFGKSHIFSD